MSYDLLVAGLFLSLLFYYGLSKTKRASSEEGYLLGSRRTSLFPLIATLVMTEFNTATLISFSSMGYLSGVWALWFPAIFLIGLLFYAVTVARKWKKYNGISVAGYFSERYGKDIGRMASGALLVAMCGFSAAYVKSLALLFSPFFPELSLWGLSALLVALVLVMMVRGGLFSIIRTDLFSFVVVLCFFPIMAYFCYKTPVGVLSEPSMVLERPSVSFVLPLIVLTMFTYILAPWYGQKIFSARSRQVAYLSVVYAAVIVFFLYGLAVMATWFFRKNGGVVPSAEQGFFIAMQTVLPPGLRGLGYAILFAASATTLSGVWSAMSAMVIGDFLHYQEKNSRRRSMVLSVALACFSYLLANLLVDRIFDQLILANIPIAALSFALLAGFYWKGTSRVGVYCSMIVGWSIGIGSYLFFEGGGRYIWVWVMWGIPAIFLSGYVGSLLFPNQQVTQEFS
ncbi:MAG: hypothetical protein KR126chlam1_00360 [Chlamydiae bacterium]|nr:hypothetical protein [Chlamydiota bacterium]